jgi:hypothetical protein
MFLLTEAGFVGTEWAKKKLNTKKRRLKSCISKHAELSLSPLLSVRIAMGSDILKQGRTHTNVALVRAQGGLNEITFLDTHSHRRAGTLYSLGDCQVHVDRQDTVEHNGRTRTENSDHFKRRVL